MNKQYQQVHEFHKAFCIEMPDKPTMLGGAKHNWPKLYAEDLEKICYSMKKDSSKLELANLTRASWMLEELTEFISAETIEDQADALIDLIYFAVGTFTLMGIKPEALFDIVHAANMGKLQDGKPIYNEQGKIVKPEGWKEQFSPEPKIKAEINYQMLERKGASFDDMM